MSTVYCKTQHSICTSQDKCTPIHKAAENGHNEVVKTLLKFKADINAVTRVCN